MRGNDYENKLWKSQYMKFKKYTKKDLLINHCLAVTILVSFFYILNSTSKKRNVDRTKAIFNHQQTAFAKVVDESFNKGHSVKYIFYYKNNKYENWMGDYAENYKLGRCYTVLFDSTDPETAYINLPVVDSCPKN